MSTTINTILLSGGAIKGIAYCGVFKRLEELEQDDDYTVDIKRICCVSVGCLYGLAYILGYKYNELSEEVLEKNFMNLKDIKITNFFTKYGLDSGNNITSWMETLMMKRGIRRNTTFDELYKQTCIKFQVVTTNLNKYKSNIFDVENSPTMLVIDAIRMSMSIPFVFTANTYQGDIHVDGCLIDNFPVYFVEEDAPNLLGIRLVSDSHENKDVIISDLEGYISNVISCFVSQKQKHSPSLDKCKEYTMLVHVDRIHTFNFNIKKAEKQKIIDAGYIAATKYFRERIEMQKKNVDKNIDE